MTIHQIEKLQKLKVQAGNFAHAHPDFAWDEEAFSEFVHTNQDFSKSFKAVVVDEKAFNHTGYHQQDAMRLFNALADEYSTIPNLNTILRVQKQLAEGKKWLHKRKEKPAEIWIRDVVGSYSGEIQFEKAVVKRFLEVPNDPSFLLGAGSPYDHMKAVVAKLEQYLEDLCEDRQKPKAKREKAQSGVNVQVINQNTNTISINIDIVNTLEAVSDVKGLSDSEKMELNKMLLEIEKLKGADKKTLWEKVKAASKWVLDKGVDATIAVMPYLLGVAK